jgi:hypothetical protein
MSRDIDARIRHWAEAHLLPDSILGSWMRMAAEDRAALLSTAEELNFRPGQLVSALEMLSEIKVRQNEGAAVILNLPKIRRIAEGNGSRPGRAKVALEAIRAIRFPELHRMSERLAEEIAALGLPSGISVLLPRNLASDELRVEIVAHGAAQMLQLIDAIGAKGPGLARIARLIDGTDEI